MHEYEQHAKQLQDEARQRHADQLTQYQKNIKRFLEANKFLL